MNNPKSFALITVLIWSFGGYTTRLIAVRSHHLLLAIALTFSTVFFAAYLTLYQKRSIISLLQAIKLKYLVLGFIGYGFFYLINVQSTLHFGNISETMVIGSSWPLFAVLFAYVLFSSRQEGSSRMTQVIQAFGMLIGFSAIIVLATKGQPHTLQISNGLGVIYALIGSSSYGLYSALSGQIKQESTLDFLFQAVLISTIILWMFSLPHIGEIRQLPIEDFAIVAFKGIAINGIGYFTWMRANQLAFERNEDVSTISSIMFLLPLLGLTIVAVLLGERHIFQPYFLTSLALILLSSVICQKPNVVASLLGKRQPRQMIVPD